MLEKLKEEEKQQMDLKFVQDLFEMQDTDKWLKLQATSEEQILKIQKREEQMQAIMEKLYVPNYQFENV